jgi:thiol-disulfide isomerase/thioredoxin
MEQVEPIALAWLAAEPDNPLPAFHLATARQKRNAGLEDAAALAARAADGMMRGRLHLYEGLGGTIGTLYIAAACRLAGRIALDRDHAAEALGWARAAVSFETETADESWLLEAEVRSRLGDEAATEAARVEAYRLGSKTAEDALRAAYEERHGATEGFAAWLASRASRPAPDDGAKPAPPFKTVSLDGAELDSAALRGKVIVLNFWSTGCAPCKVEMPSLNRLVRRYPPERVVFIALSTEPGDRLRRFLEKHPFDYHVVAGAREISEAYDVEAIPVHVIIGRRNEIVTRITGGSAEIDESLGRLIDRSLED